MDMALSVAYRDPVRLQCAAPTSPNPPYQSSMACVLSVRHGYGRSRGVHFFCTPPLHSRGVPNFVYASDEHSSYDLFPSSERDRPSVERAMLGACEQVMGRPARSRRVFVLRHGRGAIEFAVTEFLATGSQVPLLPVIDAI
jgi:hypothetical protein